MSSETIVLLRYSHFAIVNLCREVQKTLDAYRERIQLSFLLDCRGNMLRSFNAAQHDGKQDDKSRIIAKLRLATKLHPHADQTFIRANASHLRLQVSIQPLSLGPDMDADEETTKAIPKEERRRIIDIGPSLRNQCDLPPGANPDVQETELVFEGEAY